MKMDFEKAMVDVRQRIPKISLIATKQDEARISGSGIVPGNDTGTSNRLVHPGVGGAACLLP
jgi:hypothetical protein